MPLLHPYLRVLPPTFLPPLRFLHTPSLSIRHFAPITKNRKPIRSNIAPPHIPPPKNIAVVGGGLAGLAVVYHLLHSTARFARKRGFDSDQLRISIFDPSDVACGGASAVAAGLLHGFTPRVKKKAWKSLKGVNSAKFLLDVVGEKTGKDVFRGCGLVRVALNEKMEEDFVLASRRFPTEVELLQGRRLREVCGEGVGGEGMGIFLNDALVVDVPAYLRGLWEVCRATERVEWVREGVEEVGELFGKGFDTVIVCVGGMVRVIGGLEDVPITACRGQNLILEGDGEVAELNVPVIAGKYVVPDYSGGTGRVLAGATFEYRKEGETEQGFLSKGSDVDVEKATAELRQPLERLLPDLFKGRKVVGVNAGLRALPPRSEDGSIPIACKVEGVGEQKSCWVLTGLGSRGLLHHAFLGRKLAHAVVSGNERLLPMDARRFDISLTKGELVGLGS